MNQQQNLPSDGVELFKETTSVSLAERLQMLDEVDRKVVEIVESIRDLINNLDKEKQISRTKMDESAKKFQRVLDEEIMKVVSDQLSYIEQLCVGAEHQSSMFQIQNKKNSTAQLLQNLKNQIHALHVGQNDLFAEPMQE